MEKPRKKQTYEHKELNGMVEVDARYNAGWNDHDDAMSTWLEGEVPTVEEIEKVLDETIESCCLKFKGAKAIHALITRKLTGKV